MACEYSLPMNALPLRIGLTDVIGVICTSSSISLMTEFLYERLKTTTFNLQEIIEEHPCDKSVTSACGRNKRILRLVKFKARIEGKYLVTLNVSIVEQSHINLVLGCDFLKEMKSNFALDHSSFRWEHSGIRKSSDFITYDKSLDEIVESEFFKIEKKMVQQTSNEDPSTSNSTSETQEPSTSFAKKSNQTSSSSGLQSKKNSPKKAKSKSRSSKKLSKKRSLLKTVQESNFEQSDEVNTTTPFAAIRNGWGTVYIAIERVYVSETKPPIGYYGVWWFDKCDSNKICGLAVEGETMLGLNLRAVEEALTQAYEHKVMRVKIVLNTYEGVDLLKDYARKKVFMKHPQAIAKNVDISTYLLYRCVCQLIDRMSEVVFEYEKDDDEVSKEIISRLEEKVDKFIAAHHPAVEDVSREYYKSIFKTF